MQKIIGVVFLVGCLQNVFGQTPYLQHYLPLKKKQSVQVNVFLQSKSGYIWLGTDKGLFRFDGINFNQFTSANGLPDDNVTALAEDSIGRIWLGHKSGKISFMEHRSFKPFTPEEGLSSKPVSDILFDKKGILWFSTLNDGLYYFTNNRLYRLDDIDGMPDIFVYDIAEDKDGNIWAGTDGGVAVCSFKNKEVAISTIGSSQGLPDNIIKKISIGKERVWLATEDAGLVSYRFDTKKIDPVTNSSTHGKIIDLLESNQMLWVITNQELLWSSTKKPAFKSLPISNSLALFEDKEENIWIGTRNGILRTTGNKIQFIRDDSKKMDVLALAVDAQGEVWFSTHDGLFKQTLSGAIQKQLVNTKFANKNVTSLHCDKDGSLWAGLYDEGLLHIDPKSGAITQIKDALNNASVLNITSTDNALWLATLGGASQILLEDKSLRVKNYSSENGLSTDYIYQVFQDAQKRVWFATDRAGIDMLDEKGFHHFGGAIAQKVIFGFVEDDKKNIWANVQGLGLYMFDGKDFIAFKKQNVLRESNINALVAVPSALFIAHDQGIDVYNLTTNSIRYIGEESGIKDQSPNLNAVARDSNGKIYLGTTDGIVVLSGTAYESQKPKAVIEGLDIYNETVSKTSSFDLKYFQNNINIHFSGLWFQNPDNLNYKLTLENHDKDWFSSKTNSYSYSELSPGEYIFHVKVSETNDFENADEASVKITVSPPFWKTNAFYILVSLTIGFLAYSFVKLRERNLKREKVELERIVHERTLEIQRNVEEIKAQAEEIQGINENLESIVKERTKELERKNKALEEYAFINAHQLRAPVASILGLVNLMKNLPLSDSERDCMNHLEASSKKLDNVVSSITQAIERGDYGALDQPDESEFKE